MPLSRRTPHRLAALIATLVTAVGVATSTMSFAEPVAAATDLATDLAIGRTASADSNQAGHPAAHANDDLGSTRWCAADSTIGHWWQVDLGSNASLSGSQVVWEFARNYRYQISVSTNGVTFTTVADEAANTGTAQTQADTFTATARYVRITVTGLTTGTWASMISFSVYGTQSGSTGSITVDKSRMMVLTDVANEPDDEESLVRFLVYSNEFDVEALLATTSIWLRSGPREDLIRRDIDAYEQVRPNLIKHASGFPTAAALRAVTATGQSTYGMAAVGPGRSTAGSQQIIAAVDKADSRPIWVTLWGGGNTLAQALQDVQATRTAAQVAAFVAKLRVYSISDQDDAGPYLRKTFPQLFWVASPSGQDGSSYASATWSGISGDRWYNNGPKYMFDLVDNPWLTTNVITNHGPLGALYPQLKYIMEGDTPSWLGLIGNGLGWTVSPSYGGWGGRYAFIQPAGETRAMWANNNGSTRDTFPFPAGSSTTSDQATIWRWRDQYQYDFQARMDWSIADTYAKANHNPIPTLNSDVTKNVLTTTVAAGSKVNLSAAGTTDPDGNTVNLTWFIYNEAGTVSGAALSATTGQSTVVSLPTVTKAGTVHVILRATDDGTPHLTSYRRMVINVTP